MVTRPPVDSFGLALPPEWVRLPLDPHEFERFARRQRRAMAAHGSLSRPAQRQFELVLRQLRNDCARHDVSLVAVFATPVAGERGTPPALLAATCTLAVLTQRGLATDLPLTVHTVLAALTRGADAGCADVERPVAVELPAGSAVKLVRRHRAGPDPGALELFAEHFLVPYDDGRRAAALSLATPNVDLADAMRGLFDELANSLRLFAGGQPTDPTAVAGGAR